MRQVVVYPGEDGCWIVECQSLPGCISQGQIKQDVIVNIEEAVAGYVAAFEEDVLSVPDFRPGANPPTPLSGGLSPGLRHRGLGDSPSSRKVEGCRNGRSIIMYLNLHCEAGRG